MFMLSKYCKTARDIWSKEDGSLNVAEELSQLPFSVPSTCKYICKGCL